MLPIMVAPRWMDKLLPALLAFVALPAAAATLRAEVAEVATAAATLDAVVVELDWPDGADSGELRVRARSLVLTDGSYRFDEPRWTCTLRRDDAAAADDDGWHCAGQAAASAGDGSLQVSTDASGIDAAFTRGEARLALHYPRAGGPLPFEARSVPAAWLQPLLRSAWPAARFTGGTLDATLAFDLSIPDTTVIEGNLATHGLGLDTTDGRIAAAGLSVHGPLALRLGESIALTTELGIDGGELLAGPVYAALPAEGASVALTAEGAGPRWTLSRLRWRDPAALHLEGTGALDLDAEGALRVLALQARSPDLALAHARYLGTALAAMGLDGLALAGEAELELSMAAGSIDRVVLALDAVDASDGRGRFALEGVQGTAGWQRAGELDGRLGWRDATLYELPLGAAALQWRTAQGGVALRGPATIPLLGGSMTLEQFAWTPAAVDGATALTLAMALADVDLGDLSRRFGWPEFGGTLSGRIPAAHYEGGVLTLDGGLEMQVFDGRIGIDTLTLERPFGVAPTLGADIRLSLLDLVPLTEAFGFGRISGRLDGRVANLRLVDWEPVAFDAEFLTSTTADDKRRISQRAVSDLSSVGGGGIAGGIQQQVLKMFETFPYRQIGLSCRLDNNVCSMGGLPGSDSSGAGYTIVEGSGLPRITVVGHQRRVDWPVLVSRLKAATAGQGPVVQ